MGTNICNEDDAFAHWAQCPFKTEDLSCVEFQARIQEFTLVGAPWIGEGSGDRQGR